MLGNCIYFSSLNLLLLKKSQQNKKNVYKLCGVNSESSPTICLTSQRGNQGLSVQFIKLVQIINMQIAFIIYAL